MGNEQGDAEDRKDRAEEPAESRNVAGAVEHPTDPAEGARTEDLPPGADTAQ